MPRFIARALMLFEMSPPQAQKLKKSPGRIGLTLSSLHCEVYRKIKMFLHENSMKKEHFE